MADTLQLLITGVESGLAYSLIALALILVFKTAAVINFAQGTLAALSGYMTYWILTELEWPWALVAIGSLALTFLLGVVIERVAVRPLLKSGFFAIVIATLALDSFFLNFTEWAFGPNPLPFPPPLGGVAIDSGGIRISTWSIVIVCTVLVVLAAIAYMIQRTELGLAMRGIRR